MSSAPSGKPQSEKELKATRTLNTVATIGAGHALYAMTPEKKREAAREKLLKITPEKTRPGARKILATLKQPKLGGKLTTAGKVVAGGWLGLHTAELAGDVMARRSINNQLAQVQAQKNKGKVNSVKKNDQSMISKADGASRLNGRGVNLEFVEKAITVNTAMMYENHKNKKKVERLEKEKQTKLSDVTKAYRRFDPEADRQRRLGMASVTGVAGAGAIGQRAARNVTTKVKAKSGSKLVETRGLAIKPGASVKRTGLLTLAALASGASGVGAYKHSLSARNQPWT